MNRLKKIMALVLCLLMTAACVPAASAAEQVSTIQPDKLCSLTIFKYDWTNAKKDGIWNEDSFTSTGWGESYVEDTLGNAVRKGYAFQRPNQTSGNGDMVYGYALKGVGFTALRVADIATFTESAGDQHPDYNLTQVLYGFDKVKSADLLKAIGLAEGAQRYENADSTEKLDPSNYYYTADTINKALSGALSSNATAVKDALETYIRGADGAVSMPKTNAYGKTQQLNLPVGLYLLVETEVPEMVTSTTAPFFVSLPMTTVSGNTHSVSPAGGSQWNYQVTVYPKNETGLATFEKKVREAKTDTGKNNGSDLITDGFQHHATGSAGDVMEFQLLSTLPTITSQATALTEYTFEDTMAPGLAYTKTPGDVKIQIFRDPACTEKIAEWTEESGQFEVLYETFPEGDKMTVSMAAPGLREINGSTENANGALYKGYSNYTMRVTYTAKIKSEEAFVTGEDGNQNMAALRWKRTSADYWDTLVDDAHVYSFGLDITKLFSQQDAETAESTGMYDEVRFRIFNKTDNYYVTAALDEQEGVYYVTGRAADASGATILSPVTSGGKFGQIILKGAEDDEYVITEVKTADGYTLLKDDIHVVIQAKEDTSRECGIYDLDMKGIMQNDGRFSFDGGQDLHLANIPQKQLKHYYMTAEATVDGNAVKMLPHAYEASDSKMAKVAPAVPAEISSNALAPLTVVNTRGFDLPQTGDHGTWMYGVIGVLMMTAATAVIIVSLSKKKEY